MNNPVDLLAMADREVCDPLMLNSDMNGNNLACSTASGIHVANEHEIRSASGFGHAGTWCGREGKGLPRATAFWFKWKLSKKYTK